MKTTFRWTAAIVSSLVASVAIAEFHTYQIEQLYSNASGTVQFIVMHEAQGMSAEYFWQNNKITANLSYTFPNNLPVGSTMCDPYYGCGAALKSTANTRVLIATQGFADLGILAPDFVVPNGFLSTPGGTVTYAGGYDKVIYSALPTDGVNAINRTGAIVPNLATNFAGNSASVTAASGLDLNQSGLTGSWFKPATSGQGLEVQVSPDSSGPGTGFVFVSWFTFDNVVGGPEHQRWYTLQGPVVSGQPNASLTIYQNTGGNFNAPPATNAQVVGTATLSFDTCSGGQLSYSFTDGTGRTGSIALTRLTQNATCSTTTARPTNADFAFSGNWYDAATSGQGFTVEVNPNSATAFLAWYTYVPNGAGAGAPGQRWYTAQPSTAVAPGTRSIPVKLYETTGGMFDAVTAVAPTNLQVGTGTLTFQSCAAATFNYTFTGGSSNGLSGTIALSRLGQVPPGCT